MENPRFRRPGCQACKFKRVKCDRSIPSCQRCLKLGKECPGYPYTDWNFRDMSKVAENKVKKRVKDGLGKRQTASLPLEFSQTAEASRSLYGSSSARVSTENVLIGSIYPQISTNWHDVAIPRFYADYVYLSPSLTNSSTLKFIPEIASSSKSCMLLNKALQAVALMSLANQNGLDHLALEANHLLFQAISLMTQTLQDPQEAKKDTTLVSSYLFGMFNLINGYDIGKEWDSFHRRGRSAILVLRGDEDIKTETSQNLWGFIYVVNMSKSVYGHQPPPVEAEVWLRAIKQYKPVHKLSMINIEQAKLGVKAQALFDEPIQDEWWVIGLLKIIKESIHIDDAYQDWESSTKDVWNYKEIHSTAQPDLPHQHIYHDFTIAGLWNQIRSFRIHLHEVLLHCCTLIESHIYGQTLSFDFDSTRKLSSEIISQMISDVCASLPFCLGFLDERGNAVKDQRPSPIKGYFAMPSIYVCMVSATDGSELQTWLRGKLDYISNAMGLRLARRLAHREKRDPWNIR